MSFFKTLQEQTSEARAQFLATPIINRALRGQIDRATYVAFLTQAYYHVKHTVPLMMAVGSRLSDEYNWLRSAAAEYIEEEIGHEEWILNDIRACGADAEAVRQGRPDLSTELMVSYAWDTIQRGNPVGFFGMVLVLEGTSTAIATQAAQVIQQSLDLPTQAFSYLLSHGSLDQQHIVFFENLMNRIDKPADQAAIIHAANVFFTLYGNIFRALDHDAPPVQERAA